MKFDAIIVNLTNLLASSKRAGDHRIESDRISHRKAKPIPYSSWPERFPAKDHCSRCGLCESTFVSEVVDSCAFIGEGMSKIDSSLENIVHNRCREMNGLDASNSADELRFGVQYEPLLLAKGNTEGAQWTGVVTGIAISMLESGMVDAVICIAGGESNDTTNPYAWSEPHPIVAKTIDDILKGRGVKPALAPSLAVLDEIQSDPSVRRLLFCGVGCAVQAFRSVQSKLDLDEVYVLGTNCADNSPTSHAARSFIEEGLDIDPNSVLGYEFMQDFRVHVKLSEADKSFQYKKLPYFCLPGSIAETAIAKSCLACFDYTNSLADVVIGYMASPMNDVMSESMQSITVRNTRGKRMIQAAIENNRLSLRGLATGNGEHDKLAKATLLNDNIILKMSGGKVKDKGMPQFAGEIMANLMTMIGPTGINFAKYSIDYHVLRNYLYCVNTWGLDKTTEMIPLYAQSIVDEYFRNDKILCDLRNKMQQNSETAGQ